MEIHKNAKFGFPRSMPVMARGSSTKEKQFYMGLFNVTNRAQRRRLKRLNRKK